MIKKMRGKLRFNSIFNCEEKNGNTFYTNIRIKIHFKAGLSLQTILRINFISVILNYCFCSFLFRHKTL